MVSFVSEIVGSPWQWSSYSSSFVSSSPPRLELDLRVQATDGDWEPVVKTASSLVVPAEPFAASGAASLDVPLEDELGTSFNLILYVFEHAPVKAARLSLTPAGPWRVRLGLDGLADVRWSGEYDREVPLSLDVTSSVEEVVVLAPRSEDEARAACQSLGLPVAAGAPGTWQGRTWRMRVSG